MEKAEEGEGLAEGNTSVVSELPFLLLSVMKGLQSGEENGYFEKRMGIFKVFTNNRTCSCSCGLCGSH